MRLGRLLIASACLACAAPALAAKVPVAQPEGLWLGPHNNVAVRTGPCGDRLCGWVVWADREAQDDARDGGTARLIGTELLEDYRADGKNEWRGTVFVPDMGRRFSSQISQLSPAQMRVKGCILGGLLCKSQTWTRIDRVPGD
ncbi:DUF2147 domain-containing protein [Sphingobium sp. EM0848]|uniref:DUF2147 domain-containing protein n=1 Tax=Sphingobium sp. EM0848 TaxID=2743473 RepID=UPI00159C0293|nr:DUF2147 domain-containing protein [Sphingobium sp. EM0848]